MARARGWRTADCDNHIFLRWHRPLRFDMCTNKHSSSLRGDKSINEIFDFLLFVFFGTVIFKPLPVCRYIQSYSCSRKEDFQCFAQVGCWVNYFPYYFALITIIISLSNVTNLDRQPETMQL